MRQHHFPPRALAPGKSSGSGQAEAAYDQACQSGKNCGRHETRSIETIPISAASCGFPYAAQAGRISTTIELPDGEITFKSHILITSVEQSEMGAVDMLMARRSYWGVESGLHARLDVTAMEDKSRVRLRNNALNLALMRRAAVSIACAWMRQEPNARKANLPGFYDAVRSEVVGLLTEPPTRCSAFIT